MAVVQWNPWTELETFTRELNRVFDFSLPRPFSSGQHTAWQPSMDVHETDAAYLVEVDLPGMTIDDITVQLEDTTLMIAGERKTTHNGTSRNYAHVERAFGTFRRTFTLPTAVQRDEVHATYTQGVLSVTVPKADTARPRQIPVQAA